jgi:hypothetical protein
MSNANLLTLDWASRINQYAIPQNLSTMTYAELFTQHILNLKKELVTNAGWTVISCSYYDPAQGYRTSNSDSWSSIENIKFPESMVSAPLSANGEPNFTLISQNDGLYTPTEHPWILLRRQDASNRNLYITIDARYPLPPHKENVSILTDEDKGQEILKTSQIILGASRFGSAVVNFTAAKAPSVLYKNQELDFYSGIAIRDNVSTVVPVNYGDEPQTWNARTTCFVDIIYTNVLPIAKGTEGGNTSVRPLTNYDNSPATLFDNKSIITCWGFDSMIAGASINDDINDTKSDFYHFHYDTNSGAFIYQISDNTVTGNSSFTSMCGWLQIANPHAIDPIPYTSLTLNVDPGFSDKTLCFNNPAGDSIRSISSSYSTMINLTRDQLNMSGSDVCSTFYNVCFRNYNFSNNKGSIRYGAQKDTIGKMNEESIAILPAYTPILPKDSSLFVRDVDGIKVRISGSTIIGALKDTEIITTENLTRFASYSPTKDSSGVITNPQGDVDSFIPSSFTKNGEKYTVEGEYKISTTASFSLTKTYDVYALADTNFQKEYKVLKTANIGDPAVLQRTIKDAIGINYTNIADFALSPVGINAAVQATYLNVARQQILNCLENNKFIFTDTIAAAANPNVTLFPDSVLLSTSSYRSTSLLPSIVFNANNTENYVNTVESSSQGPYVKLFVGTTAPFILGGTNVSGTMYASDSDANRETGGRSYGTAFTIEIKSDAEPISGLSPDIYLGYLDAQKAPKVPAGTSDSLIDLTVRALVPTQKNAKNIADGFTGGYSYGYYDPSDLEAALISAQVHLTSSNEPLFFIDQVGGTMREFPLVNFVAKYSGETDFSNGVTFTIGTKTYTAKPYTWYPVSGSNAANTRANLINYKKLISGSYAPTSPGYTRLGMSNTALVKVDANANSDVPSVPVDAINNLCANPRTAIHPLVSTLVTRVLQHSVTPADPNGVAQYGSFWYASFREGGWQLRKAILNDPVNRFSKPSVRSFLQSVASKAASGTRTQGPVIPLYIKVPLNDIFKPFKYIETANTTALAYDMVSGSGGFHWRTSQTLASQKNGSSAFSVFKSLNKFNYTSLVAATYTVNEDINKMLGDFSVFGVTTNNQTATSLNEKRILLSGKNSSDSTYSELPIFLISTDPKYPELKGYATDITWGPSTIPDGALVRNPESMNQDGSTVPGKKLYSKIFWKGWWMPWLADDTPNWG